jgi:hypothetical protein
MWSYNENNVGEFTEVEHGHIFTYRKIEDRHYNPYGVTHMIDVLDGIRYAIVKKTVAYVVVDEAPDGRAVFNKWKIKKHVTYANS